MEEEAFEEIKNLLTNALVTAYFAKDATRLITNASPVGLEQS